MVQTDTDWVRIIHQGPHRLVLVCVGAGTDAVARLLAEPGASHTLLQATVPYAESALRAFAPGVRGRAVSQARARILADRAYDRAGVLAEAGASVVGVACTAALTTNRDRRGEEQAFLCLRFRRHRLHCRLPFAKGLSSRARQEQEVSRVLLAAIAAAQGGAEPRGVAFIREPVGAPDTPMGTNVDWMVVHRDGQWHPGAEPAPILFPGSFNPLHRGHVRLAAAVTRAYGESVDLELSMRNADKPPLADTELDARLAGIQGRFRVVLTQVPTFLEKARLFSGRSFVVGFDTARRLIEPTYYANDRIRRDAALAEMRDLGCRYIVAGRLDGSGYLTLPDLLLPDGFGDLFHALPPECFREDISATELRDTLP